MYMNSTQSEKLIIECFIQERMWNPEKYGDAIFYRGTLKSDRDSLDEHDQTVHLFDYETDKKLSLRELVDIRESLVNHFVPDGDTTGQVTCYPCVRYMDTFTFVHNVTNHETTGYRYEIGISFFMDI